LVRRLRPLKYVNRPEIALKTFSPVSDTIVFDLKALSAACL
jgi:hypothetical protein